MVSVSGPKMYKITMGNFAKRTAENTQLYQIVDIDKTVLRYRAYTATGELYDQFELHKREEAPNLLMESFAPLPQYKMLGIIAPMKSTFSHHGKASASNRHCSGNRLIRRLGDR